LQAGRRSREDAEEEEEIIDTEEDIEAIITEEFAVRYNS